jgi:transcriptional regulator with XRE-family HTH domain
VTRRRPTFRAWQLGRELRRLRGEIGFNQHQVGKKLRITDSSVSRFETGESIPQFALLTALLDLYGVTADQHQEYAEVWERAKEKGWWHAYGLDNQGYVSMEADAVRVREFQLGYVPGLLQTEAYARAAITASPVRRSRKWIEDQIAVRLRRQERLAAEDEALEFHAIIDETALREPADDPDVVRAQLRHITRQAELSTVTVQVVRRGALHPGLIGSFIVLTFPDREMPEMAYVEHAAGSVHIEDDADVRGCTLRFDRLRSLALSPDESLVLIRRMADASRAGRGDSNVHSGYFPGTVAEEQPQRRRR